MVSTTTNVKFELLRFFSTPTPKILTELTAVLPMARDARSAPSFTHSVTTSRDSWTEARARPRLTMACTLAESSE